MSSNSTIHILRKVNTQKDIGQHLIIIIIEVIKYYIVVMITKNLK